MQEKDRVRYMLSALPHASQVQAIATLLRDPVVIPKLQEIVSGLGPEARLDLLEGLTRAKASFESPGPPIPAALPTTPQTPKPRRRLPYDSTGTLIGTIAGHSIIVRQSSGRHFLTVVDGEEYWRLPESIVEGELGLRINRKKDGGNSETHGRAVWRHLADKYNTGDQTVSFELLGAPGGLF